MPIGKNRLPILLCAWIACVFMFVVFAARMFYGAGTTGELSVAREELKSPPQSRSDTAFVDQQTETHKIQPVSHSIFSSPEFRPQQTAIQQAGGHQPLAQVSILPDHVLNAGQISNADQTAERTTTVGRAAVGRATIGRAAAGHHSESHKHRGREYADWQRTSRQPIGSEVTSCDRSWSILPGVQSGHSRLGHSSPDHIASYSQLPAHRQPSVNGTGHPASEAHQQHGDRRNTQTVSSTRPTDHFLQIPNQRGDGIPEQQFQAPSGLHSGWSNFGNAPQQVNAAWWEPSLTTPLFPDRITLNLSLGACLQIAQTNSPELQVLQSDWYIEQAESDRLAAAFDWVSFVEAVWNRDSNPVGNDLDGAASRLRSRSANASFGARRQTETGSEFEISQQIGWLSSNSTFLNPNPQSTSRLQFEYEKPLLRGFGEEVNTSPQKLAAIARDTAYDRFRIGVQDYLLNVSSAYWTLVLQRGVYLQAQASLNQVQTIATEMAQRAEVDVSPGMLDRAQSEVAIRKASFIQAGYDVLQAQSTLLRLIYGAEFQHYSNHEVVTNTLPLRRTASVHAEERVQSALQQRSEVHQAIREIKAATVRYNLAANQVLPALNFVLTGYVAGLDAGSDIGTAWLNKFSEGEPGVGIGFDFEVPYRNRAAEAAAERQQIAIKRVQAALQAVIADVGENVRNQVIERNKYADMLHDQQEAVFRVRSLLNNANIRREALADGNQVADLYLENLLQIQNRLEAAESAYLQSQVRYSLADNALLRAMSEIDSLASDHSQPVVATPYGAPTPYDAPTPLAAPSTTGHSFGQ